MGGSRPAADVTKPGRLNCFTIFLCIAAGLIGRMRFAAEPTCVVFFIFKQFIKMVKIKKAQLLVNQSNIAKVFSLFSFLWV